MHNFFNQTRPGAILGSDAFKKSMAQRIDTYNLVDIPDSRPLKQLICPSVQQVLLATAHFYNVSISELISSKPKISNWPRLVAIYLCVKFTGQLYFIIAQHFERASKNCISQAFKRVNAKINQSESMRYEISCIVKKLNES